jgi:hypothetical protein
VVNDLNALVRGAAIGGRAAADGRVPARRADPPARLDRRALRGRALSCPFFVWALARSIFEDDFRLRAAHWIILAVIVIAGVAQSALARVLDPWIVTTLRVGFRLLSLALIVHCSGWCGADGRPILSTSVCGCVSAF